MMEWGTVVLKGKHVTAGYFKKISLGTCGPCCGDKVAGARRWPCTSIECGA